MHTFPKVLIIFVRICSKIDCTLKLQLIFNITVMSLSFSVKLIKFQIFWEAVIYSKILCLQNKNLKLYCNFFSSKNNWSISNFLIFPWIFNIKAKMIVGRVWGGGDRPLHFSPTWLRACMEASCSVMISKKSNLVTFLFFHK